MEPLMVEIVIRKPMKKMIPWQVNVIVKKILMALGVINVKTGIGTLQLKIH